MKKLKLVLLWLGIFGFWTVNQASQAQTPINGKVVDTQNRPIPGVVVNNGINFTVTNQNGTYSLPTDIEKCRHISISVPADYYIPVNELNLIEFYKPIKKEKSSDSYNFTLKKRERIEKKFTYLVFSDPQPKNDFHFVRFFTETVPDVKKFLNTKQGDVYGFVEGDIVSDALHLYPLYTSAVASWNIPIMHVIGNHDFDQKFAAFSHTGNKKKYAEHEYESFFGPTDYSLNIGDIHIICMKDIDYLGNKKYNTRFLKEQLEWLKKDLSYVKPGSTVFLNVHVPLFNMLKDSQSNAKSVLSILQKFNVHIFSGHTHFHKNEILANNIYEHNVGAVCGFHWQGNSSRCGTPNGYMIVDVDGDNIRWHFKPTGHDLSYQFKIYKPGEFSSQTEYIVANVWDWDNTYKINWYEDSILKGSMEQFSDIDQDFIDSGRVKVYRTDHLFRAKPSSTAKEIKIEVINRFGETYTKTIEL